MNTNPNNRVVTVTTWLFATITVITAIVLILIALLHPESTEYTIFHKLGFALASAAGVIAQIISLFVTKNLKIRGFLVLVTELYLFGLFFNLFALIT